MAKNIKYRPGFILLITGFFFLLASGQSLSQLKTENAKVPQIRRIATFQHFGGEKLLRSPLSIDRDNKNGDLIITSFEAGEVVILDRSGALVNRLGQNSGITSPYGVAIDDKGQIYISEIQTGFLKILSPAGILADKINLSEVMGRPVSPGRITLDKNGYIYVVDLMDNEIIILNSKGDLVKTFGEFKYLQKAGSVNGDILGLSAYGKAVSIFNRDGDILRSFGEHADESAKSFSFPTGFAVDSKERLWITDAFQHRLKVFSLDGRLLFNYGRIEEKSGGFFFPVDICFGENGEFFVLEKGANRIQIFQVEDLKE